MGFAVGLLLAAGSTLLIFTLLVIAMNSTIVIFRNDQCPAVERVDWNNRPFKEIRC